MPVICPFDGDHDIKPDEPCPVCGDLGFTPQEYDDTQVSNCVANPDYVPLAIDYDEAALSMENHQIHAYMNVKFSDVGRILKDLGNARELDQTFKHLVAIALNLGHVRRKNESNRAMLGRVLREHTNPPPRPPVGLFCQLTKPQQAHFRGQVIVEPSITERLLDL